MKRLFTFLLALALSPLAFSQSHVVTPLPTAGFMTPDVNMPASAIFVKTPLPPKHYGSSTIDIAISCGPVTTINGSVSGPTDSVWCGNNSKAPNHLNDGPGGAFRILCNTSHYAFDDPIVKPFQSGMSHGHVFFGNTTTDASRDPAKMADYGRSTCAGGIANRTGYWTPFIVYHCPALEVGCTRSRDGEVFKVNINNAYYKTQNFNAANLTRVHWWPVGFRMITGNPGNIDPAAQVGRVVCINYSAGGALSEYNHFPSATEANGTCGEVNFLIDFPSCSATDETVLYLPTPNGGNASGHIDATQNCTRTGFTSAHPNIAYNVHTPVATNADWDYLVLSSDKPMHAGVTPANGTTTSITLASSEYAVTDAYKYGYLIYAGQRRQITGYNGSTKVATFSPALSSAPTSGSSYAVRMPGGRTLHADWANGWSHDPNFNGWGRSITDQIIRGCYFNVARYGNPTGNTLDLDCHDDNLGEPGNDSTAEPRVGGTYWWLIQR